MRPHQAAARSSVAGRPRLAGEATGPVGRGSRGKDSGSDDRPPFAADDPLIDLITISDRYANGAPPPAPSATVFEGNYAHVAEQWSIEPLHDGYLSLLTHDRSVNSQADRWVPQVSAGQKDGGFLYYNDVTLERDGWYVRATGFYPVEKGKAASTVDLSRFLVQSLTIRHQVRG